MCERGRWSAARQDAKAQAAPMPAAVIDRVVELTLQQKLPVIVIGPENGFSKQWGLCHGSLIYRKNVAREMFRYRQICGIELVLSW
jgi:hypothetical protein